MSCVLVQEKWVDWPDAVNDVTIWRKCRLEPRDSSSATMLSESGAMRPSATFRTSSDRTSSALTRDSSSRSIVAATPSAARTGRASRRRTFWTIFRIALRWNCREDPAVWGRTM
jgi:hypothetical protein